MSSASTEREPRWPHTGAVLIGGRSVRMGRPKHLLPMPDGRSMLQTVTTTVADVCAKIVIVGDAAELPADVVRIADRREGLGPLGGIHALLAAAIDEEHLIVPCDTPLMTSDILRALVDAPHDEDALATALVMDGEPHPRSLPIRLSAKAMPIVETLLAGGHRSVWRFLESVRARLVPAPSDWAALLHNVNTPEDLAAARASSPRERRG